MLYNELTSDQQQSALRVLHSDLLDSIPVYHLFDVDQEELDVSLQATLNKVTNCDTDIKIVRNYFSLLLLRLLIDSVPKPNKKPTCKVNNKNKCL